jgi:arylsulfatase A-like enzyme
MRLTIAAWVAALLAAPATAQPTARRPNVILVALDQLQADRLHCHGNPRPTSPNLDRMAREGVRLSRFYSSSPWTTPSYASMMTGQYPSRHGATLFQSLEAEGLRKDAVTLAELFRQAGYKTAAFVNNGNAGRFLTGRGFDDYDEGQRRAPNITERVAQAPEYTAPPTNARVMKWLDANEDKPFFLFLLYFEPHTPYDPPVEHDLFKNGSYPDETNTGYDLVKGRLFRWANLGDPKAIDRVVQLYDGKIHFIDHHFGRVLDHLRTSGLQKNTIVLLTSDHGELLFSHRSDYMTFDHRSLYDAVMHIPFLLWGAGIPQGKTFDALASHIDIAPTLLDLAGLPPKADAQGTSLVPLVRGKVEPVHPYVFGEQDISEPLRSVRDRRYKLILNLRTGRKQLFDTAADPAEQNDIAEAQPKIVEELSAVLARWRAENEPDPAERDRSWREKAIRQEVIDEITIGARCQLTGTGWRMADGLGNFGGGCYWTEPAKPSESLRTAKWRTDNPMLGRYRVSIWYGSIPGGGAATNAPFTVETRTGSKTVRIDQTRNAGAWRELGVFENPYHVMLTNEADGRIIADAAKFERVEE